MSVARPLLLQRDGLVFILGIALALIHVMYEAVLDRALVLRAVGLTVVSIVLIAMYNALGRRGRGRMALILGIVGVVVVSVTHLLEIARDGLNVGRALAGFAVVGTALLIALGATMLAELRAPKNTPPR